MFHQSNFCLSDLCDTCRVTSSSAHNRIEKVQLPDMGSYRCAVLSESHRTLSDEGNIQLEGELSLAQLLLMYRETAANINTLHLNYAACVLFVLLRV